jgi:hypothetical protein
MISSRRRLLTSEGTGRYRETAEVRAEEFGSHLDDTVLDNSTGR